MEDKTAVAKEGTRTLVESKVVVLVVGGVAVVLGLDVAPFAAQVTDLARFRGRGVTRNILTPDEWIQVSKRRGAIAVFGNGFHVDVVSWEVPC